MMAMVAFCCRPAVGDCFANPVGPDDITVTQATPGCAAL